MKNFPGYAPATGSHTEGEADPAKDPAGAPGGVCADEPDPEARLRTEQQQQGERGGGLRCMRACTPPGSAPLKTANPAALPDRRTAETGDSFPAVRGAGSS